jgi:hypothetical protein
VSFDTDFDGGEDDGKLEAHERRIVRCSKCRARIVWFRTARLRMMPIDADSVNAEDAGLDLSHHVSHFATCPNAEDFRRPR